MSVSLFPFCIYIYLYFLTHIYYIIQFLSFPVQPISLSIELKSNLIRLQHSLLQCTGPCKGCACSVAQWCPPLCNHMDIAHQTPLSVGFFQARILEWVAISYSRGSSWPSDGTYISIHIAENGIISFFLWLKSHCVCISYILIHVNFRIVYYSLWKMPWIFW